MNQKDSLIMDIPEKRYKEIMELIKSEESPVGIDAGKTHVLILHKIEEIEKRLAKLEERFPDRKVRD